MKISVKTLKGELFQVEAEGSDKVSDLKAKIEDSKADHPAARQKLIHSGKVLKDEQVISELGIAESDFIVCMITKEVAKKAAPAPAPAAAPAPTPVAAPAPTSSVPSTPAAAPAAAASPAAASNSQFVSAEGLAALTSMGFPEDQCRAALAAAMGNPDLAYEFLLTGIPAHAAPRTAAPTAAAPTGAVTIDALRRHPQFNMLKQLVQQNPGALSQVLDLIGQQSPELLAAIHANNDAFIAMMNEPIVDTPPPAPTPAQAAAPPAMGGNPLGSPAAAMQMLAAMPAAQRAQFAAQMGMAPQQLEAMMQMMASLPPDQLEQIMGQAGGMMGGGMGADPPGVIRLTEDEMAAVNRLMALGFSQQQAAQAYLACDKNETLAANLLFEGGWGDEGDDMGGYGGGHDDGDDNMYH